jgi:hypothetical protein
MRENFWTLINKYGNKHNENEAPGHDLNKSWTANFSLQYVYFPNWFDIFL